MAPRKTRSVARLEGKAGSQRTLFEVISGNQPAQPIPALEASNEVLVDQANQVAADSGTHVEPPPDIANPLPSPTGKRRKIGGPKSQPSARGQPNGLFSIFTKPGPSRTSDVLQVAPARADDASSKASSVPSSRSSSPILACDFVPPQAGSSRDEAIVVDSSPVRLIKAPQFTTATFSSKLRRPPHAKDSESPLPPLPSDSHTRGPQTMFPSSNNSTLRAARCRTSSTSSDFHPSTVLQPHAAEEYVTATLAMTPVDPTERVATLEALLQASQDHPAIRRLLDHVRNHPISPLYPIEQLPWTEKWRPVKAEQVLGNEQLSRYLRDWLAFLQLGAASLSASSAPTAKAESSKRKRKSGNSETASRPVIVRAVDRSGRRKRVRMDSEDEQDHWIEPDSEDPFLEESEDELVLAPAPQLAEEEKAVPTPTSERFSFEDRCTNTILITGPSGCGKTAAVFACAAELGYEVFEVYPGIGRRSGAELERLIGDVGKNHLVNKGDASGRSTEKLKSRHPPIVNPLFASATAARTPTPVPALSPSVGQSVVLLEEVDVLYKDDVNFWHTVINIIKECRRPVILTCNDSSLVPVEDLPLQAILEYKPCPSPLASTYLHALGCAEGRFIQPTLMDSLYPATISSIPTGVLDTPLHPHTQYSSSPDLRLAINTLESGVNIRSWIGDRDRRVLSRSWGNTTPSHHSATDGQQELSRLKQLYRHTDNISYADVYVVRSDNASEERLETDSVVSTSDETGITILRDDIVSWDAILSFYDQDKAMAQHLAGLSLQHLEHQTDCHVSQVFDEGLDWSATFRARADYQLRLLDVLGRLLSISSPLLPRPSAFIDYEAWIRIMVKTDDAMEAAVASGAGFVSGRGRTTRNSAQKHVRWLSISEDHRAILAATALNL